MLHGGKELICWLLFLMLKHWCMSKQGILYLSATWNGSHWIPSASWRIWVSCWSISLNIDKPTKGAILWLYSAIITKKDKLQGMGGICWELGSHINVNPNINNKYCLIHTYIHSHGQLFLSVWGIDSNVVVKHLLSKFFTLHVINFIAISNKCHFAISLVTSNSKTIGWNTLHSI